MPIPRCSRPSLGRPVADVIDKKDQFLCRICLSGNAVKPCRPRSAAAPSFEVARQIPSSRCQRCQRIPKDPKLCQGPQTAPHPVPDRNGGARRDRTDDLLLAKQALSQLSYGPALNRRIRSNAGSDPTRDEGQRGRSTSGSRSTRPSRMVGLGRLELPTSRLSGVRSNHLSYRPEGSRTHVRPERKRNEDGGIPPDGA
jgi:hypothetical protein